MTSEPSQPSNPARIRREAVPAAPERQVCAPPIDIYETDEGLVLEADLPGVTAEDLDLQIQDNKLTLFGRVRSRVSEEARLLHREFHACDWLRSFILSEEVDHERISARISNGVLEVTLPTAQKPAPRRIQVNSE